MHNQILITSLQKELEEAFLQYKITTVPEIDRKKEILSESFGLLAPVQGMDFSILDLSSGSFSSVNPQYKYLLECPAIVPNKKISGAPWITLTHPNDLAFILSLAIASLHFLNWLPTNRMKDFSLSYQHRLKGTDGRYHCFFISYKVLMPDVHGRPYILLQNVKLCSLAEKEDDKRYRVGFIEPSNLVTKSGFFRDKELIHFTRQEKEIIRKVNDDKACSVISNELNISDKTTRKHFHNINKKANFHSVKQAALHLSKFGLLQVLPFFISFFDDYAVLIA